MRISTSTGDFSKYVGTIAEKVKCFKETKFKYINFEQTGANEYLEDNDDGWRKIAEDAMKAAEYAGVEYVVSHAPCVNPFEKLDTEHYDMCVRAVRRSVEVCHILGISRIVVHTGWHESFDRDTYYKENKRFYTEFFDLMEKYNITVMTENVHDWQDKFFVTGTDLREMVDLVDHPLFAACWDTAHANLSQRAVADGQYKCITDIGDALKGLHISDNLGDTTAHHHSWPFAGIINFDEVIQALIDVNYDGYFNFEASYTLLHSQNLPRYRKSWVHNGVEVKTLLNPSVELKSRAVDLLYDIGKYMLEAYNCFEE